MKTRLWTIWVFAALGLGLAAQAAPLKIVATTTDLAAIARAVAGDEAVVRSITTGKEDPHMLQAKPSVILQARDADLWIRIGLELEIGWEPPILDGSRNARIRPGMPGHLDASKSALVLDVPETAISRAMGDVHPMGNPHYWLDPLNGRRIAGAIADRLVELRPEAADVFRRNADAFQRDLDERMFGRKLLEKSKSQDLWLRLVGGEEIPEAGGWLEAMAPLRGQKILTYHRSWVYFAHRFGLEIAGELEPKPGVPPTAAHLAELVELAKARDVQIILQEPFYSTKAAEQVASKTGARVVVVANSVGGQPEATDYLALMDWIVEKLTEK